MRILVTGGAGFIGSSLARRLADDGHDVIAADSFLSSDWRNLADFAGDLLALAPDGDIAPLRALNRFDIIFHQASITGVLKADGTPFEDDPRILRNNIEGFRNILEWALEMQSQVIWASSCSVYGRGPVPMVESQPADPLNAYAFSKVIKERLAAKYASRLGKPIVGLRYSNVYGPGEAHKGKLASMIYQLAEQMRAGQRPRIFRGGQQRRDFVYIDDVVELNLAAMGARESGIYNAGRGKSWSFNEVVSELNRVLGTKLEPEYFDNPYGFTQDWTQTDQAQATTKLGFTPQVDLAEGISRYHASGRLGA